MAFSDGSGYKVAFDTFFERNFDVYDCLLFSLVEFEAGLLISSAELRDTRRDRTGVVAPEVLPETGTVDGKDGFSFVFGVFSIFLGSSLAATFFLSFKLTGSLGFANWSK